MTLDLERYHRLERVAQEMMYIIELKFLGDPDPVASAETFICEALDCSETLGTRPGIRTVEAVNRLAYRVPMCVEGD